MLYDIDFDKALDPKHILKECKRIITKKIDAKNRDAYWDEYENIIMPNPVTSTMVRSIANRFYTPCFMFLTLLSPTFIKYSLYALSVNHTLILLHQYCRYNPNSKYKEDKGRGIKVFN